MNEFQQCSSKWKKQVNKISTAWFYSYRVLKQKIEKYFEWGCILLNLYKNNMENLNKIFKILATLYRKEHGIIRAFFAL